MDPVRSITLFVVLLLAGGYFAGAEISLASVNKIRIAGEAEDGDKRAKKVAYLLENFEKVLSTLLIGNNISHIGCSTVATAMTYSLVHQHNWPAGAQVISTLLTTVIVFFLAEMIPKCFAKSCNEQFAKNIAGSLIFLTKVLTPVSFLFTSVTRFLSKPFLKKTEEKPTVTEKELYDIIDTVVQEGELDEEAGELVQSALEFSESKVKEVFTPWKSVATVNENMSPEEIIQTIQSVAHSRLPVVNAEQKVIGVLQIRNYLRAYIQDHQPDLKELISEPHFVPQGMPVDDLLEEMSGKGVHIAFVTNAQNQTVGIITMEDILEELVGEIYDEEDAKGGLAHA